jgi:hypothetical protein
MKKDFTKEELYEAIELLEPTETLRSKLRELVDSGESESFYSQIVPLLQAEEDKQSEKLKKESIEPEELMKILAEGDKTDKEIDEIMDQYYEDSYEKPLREIEEEDERLTKKIEEIDKKVTEEITKEIERTSQKADKSMMDKIRAKLSRGK